MSLNTPDKQRNLSVDRYFTELAAAHRPRFRYDGKGKADWERWHAELRPLVLATLGRMPRAVPLNPEIEVEWREGGLLKQRVLFDVEQGLSARAYVVRPEHAAGRLPAILACHGHGAFGKESVMGNASSDQIVAATRSLNYDYGLRMARAGFAVIAIDWRGFGDRDDRRKPHYHDQTFGRDLCNLHFLRATMLGMTVLGMNIHDGMRALDYLCEQPFVDPQRVGVMGLSFGGTMATWLAIADPRVRAADVICYSDTFTAFAMRDANVCGSQITPGLFDLADVSDLQGLIAPRPLLVEIGVHDECFFIETAMKCYRGVEHIYRDAGAADRLELDLFEGGHRWGGNKSVEFFRRHLASGGDA